MTGLLFDYDEALGTRSVCGADEAGRGCLAGPLVAAGVRLDYPLPVEALEALSRVGDSKGLTAAQRARLFPLIQRHASAYVILVGTPAEIDQEGIAVVNLRLLGQSLRDVAPDHGDATYLSDGFAPVGGPSGATGLVKGDATSAAIAAASVLAKEHRDHLMRDAARRYPHWGFDAHKGYPTPAHRAAIAEYGLTPLHRRSFGPCKGR